jgi:hypothetical protein
LPDWIADFMPCAAPFAAVSIGSISAKIHSYS